jgi:capsule polysaccharide export protein KpsE/RkpR
MIESSDTSTMLSSAIGSLPLPIFPGITTPADKYIAILKSRRVLTAVINKFNLREVSKQKYIEDTYQALLSNTDFSDNEYGSVTIKCLYKGDPKTAADMANYFFENLESVSNELSRERARKFREYMQSALERDLASLKSAEDSLNAFQKKTGVINVEDQTKALIEQIATMEVQKINLEMQRGFLQSNHVMGKITRRSRTYQST